MDNKTAEEITSIFKVTFGTPTGKKCFDRLEEVYLNRSIFKIGMSLEEAAFRQGQYDLIAQIKKEIER